MDDAMRPVAFFDSGLGGISVLRAARRVLPFENYVYYGDSANAPYGTRPPEEIRTLAMAVTEKVLALGAKAVVVACNTATGEAVDAMRARWPEVPIIGVEPAIKPAAEAHPGGTVLVLATPLCVKSRRFLELQRRFSRETRVIPVPCPGLMEFVERGELDSPALRAYLDERLAPWRGQRIDAAVLGCTHYPFLRAAITAALPPETELIDGNAGITAQLCRRLDEHGLRNPGPHPGEVRFFNSLGTEEILRLSRQLLALPE